MRKDNKIQDEIKENDDEFYEAKDHPLEASFGSPDNKTGVAEKLSPEEELEKLRATNKDLKVTYEGMMKKLFEAKVTWADENNSLVTQLEAMRNASNNAKTLYEKLKSESLALKGNSGKSSKKSSSKK